MKTNFCVLIIFLTILTSCSEEHKIKKAFEDYAAQTFNDPSSIDEIIVTDSVDTLSVDKLKTLAKESYTALNDMIKLYDDYEKAWKIFRDGGNHLDSNPYIKAQQIEELEKWSGDKMSLTSSYTVNSDVLLSALSGDVNLSDIKDSPKKSIQKAIEKIDTIKNANFYQRLIKVRFDEGEQRILRTFYVYYNGIDDKYIVRPNKMPMDELPFSGSAMKLKDLIEEITHWTFEYKEVNDEGKKCLEDIGAIK